LVLALADRVFALEHGAVFHEGRGAAADRSRLPQEDIVAVTTEAVAKPMIVSRPHVDRLHGSALRRAISSASRCRKKSSGRPRWSTRPTTKPGWYRSTSAA